jgi:hypothetical protein
VKRPVELLQSAISPVRERFAVVASQSERTLLLGTVLLASAVSVVTGFILTQYYSVDVLSSLLYVPNDCYLDWGVNVGRHCFGDYSIPVSFAMLPNPWEHYPLYVAPDFRPLHNNYPAAGIVPHMIFGFLGKWLGAPRLGLFGYLLVLTIAVFTPAVWAARGARGLERVVVFMACGIAAIPAWTAIDRGNSVGFVVPIALVFLVALCRQRWGLVAIMVVLAALVKPQFAVLAVVLFAARRWRLGGIAVAGVAISNLAAYALWPRDFPETITQSIRNVLGYGSLSTSASQENVSFAKGLLVILNDINSRATGGKVLEGLLAGPRSPIGYVVLVLVVVSVVALGRRIPPVMVGIVLLATASLSPTVSLRYYLVFVLPVAALVVRDPDGPAGTGIFDRHATVGGRRRAVGICVSLAAAVSIVQIALPTLPPVHRPILAPGGTIEAFVNLVLTTVFLAPLPWLVTCGAIIVSYARRPAASPRSDQGLAREDPPDTAVSTSSSPELITELSRQ